jgi:glycosyltransferase involved in cell wall biosynthesis
MKVSIITVCLNSEKTIENTIQSVLFQSYKNIEYIVIDGNSTDNTKSILGKYADFISTVVSEPDKGLYDAMNKGLKLATGDVIGILNSDDLYKDLFVVEKVMKQFDEEVDAVYGDIVYVDKNDITRIVRYWHSGLFKRYKMKFGWMPPHPAFFVRRNVY